MAHLHLPVRLLQCSPKHRSVHLRFTQHHTQKGILHMPFSSLAQDLRLPPQISTPLHRSQDSAPGTSVLYPAVRSYKRQGSTRQSIVRRAAIYAKKLFSPMLLNKRRAESPVYNSFDTHNSLKLQGGLTSTSTYSRVKMPSFPVQQ